MTDPRFVFPIESELFSFELVDMIDERRGTLRLFEWDQKGGGERMIRNIKEQEVELFPAEYDRDKAVPYLEGWASALRMAFESQCAFAQRDLQAYEKLDGPRRVDWAMPSDLVFPELLTLERLKEATDFEKACLTTKSRLGKLWLTAP